MPNARSPSDCGKSLIWFELGCALARRFAGHPDFASAGRPAGRHDLFEETLAAVDIADVASDLIEWVDDGRLGLREKIGGPAAAPLPGLARQYLQARRLDRRVIVTWREWLAANADRSSSSR